MAQRAVNVVDKVVPTRSSFLGTMFAVRAHVLHIERRARALESHDVVSVGVEAVAEVIKKTTQEAFEFAEGEAMALEDLQSISLSEPPWRWPRTTERARGADDGCEPPWKRSRTR